MKHAFLYPTLLLLLAGAAWSQNLTRVRLDSPAAGELARSFEAQGYDILEGSVRPGSLELVVTDAELTALEDLGFPLEVIEVGRPFQEVQTEGAGGVPERPGYPDLASALAQMSTAATNFPSICQMVDLTARYGLAPTFQGRNMFALRISDNVGVEEDEPAFLLVGAHHCRETVTPIICLDAISRLTTQYGIDPEITAVVDGNDIWIAPVWNPDGYNYVFTVNNLWRKNRRPVGNGVGVDLNRNYPFGWSSPCAGSLAPGSCTYKGPNPASEAETKTMMALSNDQRFAKVLDLHSFGREILFAFDCDVHPLASFYQADGIRISTAAGYGGSNRPPSAEGEEYQWQLASFSSWAFLLETATAFQPPIANAMAEATLVWPGILGMLKHPVPVSGNVTDSCTGAPLAAEITFGSFAFTNGESASSGGPFGRYDTFLPVGPEILTFTAAGFAPKTVSVTVVENQTAVVDVALDPLATLAFEAAPSGSGLGGGYILLSDPCPLATTQDFVLFATTDDEGPLASGAGSFQVAGTLDASGEARVALPPEARARGWRFVAWIADQRGTKETPVLRVDRR